MKITMKTKRRAAEVAANYAANTLRLQDIHTDEMVADKEAPGSFLVAVSAHDRSLNFALLVVGNPADLASFAVTAEVDSADFETAADNCGRIDLTPRPACGSGWTGDRCTKPLGHRGFHSNE